MKIAKTEFDFAMSVMCVINELNSPYMSVPLIFLQMTLASSGPTPSAHTGYHW